MYIQFHITILTFILLELKNKIKICWSLTLDILDLGISQNK